MMQSIRKIVVALLLSGLCVVAPQAQLQQDSFARFVIGEPLTAAPTGGAQLFVIQNGVARQTTLASLRAAVLSGAMVTSQAQAQAVCPRAFPRCEFFSRFVNGLPQAVLPFSGNETVYLLQNGISTRTTIAALLAAPTTVMAALLPAEPISPAPQVVLDFASNTYVGCTSWQQCLSITRAAPQACLSFANIPALTIVGANTPCIDSTGYGWESTYGASTNSLLWSEQFDNAAYTKQNVTVVANAAVAPDGSFTADSITDNSTNAIHNVFQAVTFTSGVTYPNSFFVKSGTARYVQISYGFAGFSNSNYANFDATACALTATGSLTTPDTIPNSNVGGAQQLSNGWCRIWLINTATSSVSANVNLIMIPFATALRAFSYVGAGATLYVWGGQVDTSGISGPSPYKVTTSAPVSSDADVVSVVASSPLDNLVRGSQGYVVGDTGVVPSSGGYILSRNGTTDAFIQIADSFSIQARVGGVAQANVALGSLPFLNAGPGNAGSSWNGSGISAVLDGSVAVDSATPYGASFSPFMGSADGTQGFLNGSIRRLFAGTTKPSDATLQTLAPGQGAPLPPTGQAWFFSPSGNDGNDCKTSATACRTTSKLNGLTYTRGNTISLDAASSITGCILLNATNVPFSSAAFPLMLGAYNGSQAQLNGNCSGQDAGVVMLQGISGVTVQDLAINSTGTVGPRAGIYLADGSSNISGFVFQRLNITDIHSATPAFFSAAIFYNGLQFGGAGIDNVSILNNTFNGTSGPSSVDQAGINGFSNANDLTNFTAQGNLVFNMGGAPGFGGAAIGLEFAGINTSTAQFNITHDIGGNSTQCGGPVGIESAGALSALWQFNESYKAQEVTYTVGCDLDGFDFDIGTRNSTGQYLYSHDNYGVGMLLFIGSQSGNSWFNNTFRYSIAENNWKQSSSGGSLHIQNAGSGANYYNMTVWQNEVQSGVSVWGICCNVTSGLSGVFMNNILATVQQGGNATFFISNSNSTTSPPNFLYKNNDWFAINGGVLKWQVGATVYNSLAAWQAAAPGGDTGALSANPSFSGTGGTGGTCSWTPSLNNGPQPCPSPYVLAGGSAAKSAGIDLTQAPYNLTIGPRDYYANTIPGTGPCWNIGADGTCP